MSDDTAGQVRRFAEQGLLFAPPPDWVVERLVPDGSHTDAAVRYLLSDVQVDITGAHAWTHRVISQATSADGLNAIASFSMSYLPSFQQLIVHRVCLRRAGQVIDFADPERFQLLRREPNLERRTYDGALTADIQLSDVRPGDALETWFTVVGSNPALKGAFDASLSLAFSVPVEQTFVRLRAPSGRKLNIEVLPEGGKVNFTETEPVPGLVDREWSVSREPSFSYDDCVPPWWAAHKRINIEDVSSWEDVAALFRDGYSPAIELPDEIDDEVRRIEAFSPSAAVRAIQALRFVQSSIRYLAVSIGSGALVPREIGQIWKSRFGDCKDASRLLVSLLSRLGVDACPALVCTFGMNPDQAPKPRASAFDHCIVRVEIDGVVRWFDPTISAQGGDFERINQPDLAWALPIRANTDIERVAASALSDALAFESSERVVFGARASTPVDFQAQTILRGWRADSYRSAVRREGLSAISEHRRKSYESAYSGAVTIAPLEVVDDLEANQITLTEHYRFDNAWTVNEGFAHFAQRDFMLEHDLQVLPRKGRVQPLWLGSSRRMRRMTHFTTQVSWPVSGWDLRGDAPGIKGYTTLSASYSSKEFILETDYAITREVLQPQDFDEFLDVLTGLHQGAAVSLTVPVHDDGKLRQSAAKQRDPMGLAMFIIIVMLMIGAFLSMLARSIAS